MGIVSRADPGRVAAVRALLGVTLGADQLRVAQADGIRFSDRELDALDEAHRTITGVLKDAGYTET